MNSPKIPASYQALLASVKQTLIEGQKRIESERVRTYWETGRVIHGHILQNKDRADYGTKTVANIARDLKIDKSELNRCIQFYKQYPRMPIVGARQQLGWTHYRKLIAVDDEKQRMRLEEAAGRNRWSSRELAERIRLGRDTQPKEEPAPPKHPPQSPLTPLRGELYTYRIVTRPTVGVGEDSGLLIDLGFGIFRDVGAQRAVPVHEGDIVRSTKRDEGYRLTKIEATAAALFTYMGYVERVIDADTLKVRLDLGFGVFSRHDLRLRGIDCPEMSTKAGEEAKIFVQSYIKEAQKIIVRSSRSDKYDRYLADVFVPAPTLVLENGTNTPRAQHGRAGVTTSEAKKDIHLNNLLLENGHAVRV